MLKENIENRRGKNYYNNGIEQGIFHPGEQPLDWVLGSLNKGERSASGGKKWYTNGIKESYFYDGEQPNGWVNCRLSTYLKNAEKNKI